MRDREGPKRKRTKITLSPSISAKRTSRNLKSNRKPRGSGRKRKEKSKDSESFKRKLQIDRLKLMHLELREHSRRVNDKLEKEKDSSKLRKRESKLTLKKPDRSNSRRKLLLLLNRLELKERTTCIKSKNKNKLSFKKGRLRRIESKHLSTTRRKSEDKFQPMRSSRSRTDLITWKKVERSEKKWTRKETRLGIFSKPKYRNLRMQE